MLKKKRGGSRATPTLHPSRVAVRAGRACEPALVPGPLPPPPPPAGGSCPRARARARAAEGRGGGASWDAGSAAARTLCSARAAPKSP